MVTSVSADCKLILYADDSAIMFAHKNHEVISQKLCNVMESCSNWLVDNKLSAPGQDCVCSFWSSQEIKEHY